MQKIKGGMASDSDKRKLHIVMFPWLAFGHMIPFLELSKIVARKGHKISFLSTPRNIDRLPKLPPDLDINFVKISLPRVENLPENAEATTDLPLDTVKYLKLAYDALQDPVAAFLQDTAPDWLFYDFASFWLPPIASKLGIPSAFFCIFNAAFLGFLGPVPELKGIDRTRTTPEDFTVPPKWVPFQTTVAYKLFEILRIFAESVEGSDINVSDVFRVGGAIEGCDVLVIRSCYEFESDWLSLLEDIHRKPVVPVGLFPTTTYEDVDGDKDQTWRGIKEWLDSQEKGSVVYVAFGSEAKLSQAELEEIAMGLELSGLPFFWVLRTRSGAADCEVIMLPNGFEDRNRGRGFVCTSWAPQLKILSHESVGGFLTHLGWSSVVEAVQFEKALISLTFLSDQGVNARFLEEKMMAYSIPRDENDGWFTRDSVAESLRLVMVEERGEVYKKTIKEMKGLFCDPARQDEYIENLLKFLQTRSGIKKE